ncbi:MAG TPA: hypothetical protein PLA65_18070 [Spirochaetota bacterium]|nr:hypothetical protein [Spirochaetota bacterium]
MRYLFILIMAIVMTSCDNYFYDEITSQSLPLELLIPFITPPPEGKTTSTSTVFNGTYDGTDTDEAVSIIPLSDGGYLAAGNTRSSGAGGFDILLMKLDQYGNIEWQKTLGGSLDDKIRVIKKTSDSGYIIIGDTFSFGEGDSDIWVVKLNSAYNIEWEKAFGGTSTETASGIVENSDGSFFVAGNTKSYGKGNYDFWMLKLSSLGALEWEKTFGNANNDQAEGIIVGNDGNYIIFGQSDTTVTGRYEAFLYEVDEWGDICSSVTLNGAESEYCRALYRTSDNGFAVVMDSNSFSSSRYSMWVVKLSSDMWTVEWQKIINGARYSYGMAAIGGAGDSIIIGGNTNSYGAGYFDFWLIELSGAGAILNQKTYGLGGVDYLNDIQGNGRGGYILAGYSSSFGSGSNAMCVVSTGSDYSVTDSIIQVADSSAPVTVISGTRGSIEFQSEYNSHHVEAVGTGAVVKDGEMVGIFY